MKACYLRPSAPLADLTGAAWARVLDAEPLTESELAKVAADGERAGLRFPYDLLLLDVESESRGSALTVRRLLARHPECKLVAHVAHSLPAQEPELEHWRAALSAVDLVLAPDYRLCLEIGEKLGFPAYELTPPFSPPAPVAPGVARRIFTVVARPDYSHRDLLRELGLFAYLATRLRYRVELVGLGLTGAALLEQLARSAFVYLPEPIEDGGELAGCCATSAVLLIAHRGYGPAKVTFPYTTFDPSHAHRRMKLFFWLYGSRDFAEFFRDNARRSLVHLSDENRRVQFFRRLAYRFAEHRYFPKRGAPPALFDQIQHRAGPRQVSYAEDECIVVCLVRNGEEHLPSFLAHYRALGVQHFVFVDNGSDDETLPLLEAQSDVTVYETSLPHKHFENEMRRLVIEEHCRNRFCLNVDIDELFDYPSSDRLSLRGLLGYLREQGATAMAGYMLDMYDRENRFEQAGPLDLKTAYPYYNLRNISKLDYYSDHVNAYCDYNVVSAEHVKCYFGGIRKTVFTSKTGGHYLLTKHPLLFLDGMLEPVTNPHYCNKARVADVTCVLYHYKFTPSFKAKVSESRAANRYVKFAQNQYDEYDRQLRGKSSIRIDAPGTQRLTHVAQLVEQGFISVSPAFESYVQRVEQEAAARPLRPRLEPGASHGPARDPALTA